MRRLVAECGDRLCDVAFHLCQDGFFASEVTHKVKLGFALMGALITLMGRDPKKSVVFGVLLLVIGILKITPSLRCDIWYNSRRFGTG